MRRFACLFLLLCLTVPAGQAQEAVAQPLEIEESGAAYLRAIRLRRIEADVAYFDPSAPAPPLDTREEPAPVERSSGSETTANGPSWPISALAAAVLITIAFVFWRFGGGISLSLGAATANPGRGAGGATPRFDDPEAEPGTLASILGTADRRTALVLLARKALVATVGANGVLFQRSWTARDALRRIPRDQAHLDALRRLVLASERVQFGEYDVSEDEFRDHLAGVRPLLGA